MAEKKKSKAKGIVSKPGPKGPKVEKFPAGGKKSPSKGKTEKPGMNFSKPDLAEDSVHGPYGKSKHKAAGKPNQDAWKIKKGSGARKKSK